MPENLIDDSFRGFLPIQVLPDMLTTRIIIMDASTPLTVFARADRLDEIEIPEEAMRPIVNLMVRDEG